MVDLFGQNMRRVVNKTLRFFFSVALEPKSGTDRLSVEVYRSHTIGHTHTHTACLL